MKKKSYSEMEIIREIEKAVLTGLKKEGCQRAGKDCEVCPLAVWVENEGAWLCKPGDLLKTVKGKTSRILRQEFHWLTTKLPTLWTNSYFCSTVGGAPLNIVKQYIESQKTSQRK